MMICCTQCFNDLEIKAGIEAIGKEGNCPVCGCENVWIYDSEFDTNASVIEELLASVLKIYVPES